MADTKIMNSRLKEARKKAGLTQKQLGDIVGLSPQTISTYEIDKYPTADMFWKLAKALNVTTAWLCGDEENRDDNTPTLADILVLIETLEHLLGNCDIRPIERFNINDERYEPSAEIAFPFIPEALAEALNDREQFKGIMDDKLRRKALSLWRESAITKLKQIPAVKKDEEHDDVEENEQ